MKIDGPTLKAEFIERPNRFLSRVLLDGEVVEAHVHDPGRLKELLVKGRTVYLTRARSATRKTKYNLIMVRQRDLLVSIDSILPNRLIYDELLNGRLEPFRKFQDIRKEVKYGGSRFDFRLSSGQGDCYLEVKSATLVVDGVAMFPDAVTARGARHAAELLEAKREGHGAWIVFVVQREDALYFTPQDEIDPAFGNALREAVKGGVGVLAYRCRVSKQGVELDGEIEVKL